MYQKKIVKAVGIVIAILFILFTAGIIYFNNIFFAERPKNLSIVTDYRPIKFGLSSFKTPQGHVIEKAVMVIPVEIDEIPNKLYFQFDTGAPTTVIYENSLSSLKEIGLAFDILEIDGKTFIKQLKTNLGPCSWLSCISKPCICALSAAISLLAACSWFLSVAF